LQQKQAGRVADAGVVVEAIVMTKVWPVFDAGGQVQQHVARACVGDGKAVLAAQDLALACGRKCEIAVVGACQAQAATATATLTVTPSSSWQTVSLAAVAMLDFTR